MTIICSTRNIVFSWGHGSWRISFVIKNCSIVYQGWWQNLFWSQCHSVLQRPRVVVLWFIAEAGGELQQWSCTNRINSLLVHLWRTKLQCLGGGLPQPTTTIAAVWWVWPLFNDKIPSLPYFKVIVHKVTWPAPGWWLCPDKHTL